VTVVGDFIVILNCREAFISSPITCTVNVDVVSEPTADAVPVIAPVEVFKDNPLGKALTVIE